MFADGLLIAAAGWLADQEVNPANPDIAPPGWMRRHFRDETLAALRRLALSADSGGPYVLGRSVPCGRPLGNTFLRATVKVWEDRVLGFLPGESRPSFIHPPEMAEVVMSRWLDREAKLN